MSDAARSCRYVLKMRFGESFSAVFRFASLEEWGGHRIECEGQLGGQVRKTVWKHKIVRSDGAARQPIHALHEFGGRHVGANRPLDIAYIGLGAAESVGKLLLLQTFFDPPLRQSHVRMSSTVPAEIGTECIYCDRLYFLARDKEEGGSEYNQMPYDVYVMRPGNRLRELRKKASLTQVELADRTGVSQSAISQIENGEVSLNVPWMRSFARVLGCAPADLLEAEDNPDRLREDERELVLRYRSGNEQERQTLQRVSAAVVPHRGQDAEDQAA